MKKTYFDLWYKERADSCTIENCGLYRTFINDINNFDRLHLLNKDNRLAFRKMYGKPDTYWKNSEYYFHVWIREFNGEKFIIMTAKGKGTCIEICNTSLRTINSVRTSKAIMDFTCDMQLRIKLISN